MSARRISSWRRTAVAVACLGAIVARAPAAAPSFKPLRYDEDNSLLRQEPRSANFFDRAAFIPLDAAGGAWLTVGGEYRARYEYFRNAQWGAGVQDDDGYFLQRTMLHADWHPGAVVRLFIQLKSGLVSGRNGGPRATDEDRLDTNQAFLDLRWPASAGTSVTLRLGRQEIALGSSRLLSTREAPNVRLAFDGARLFLERKGWRIDALALRPAQTKPGTFDDSTDRGQKLWGLYAVAPWPAWRGAHLDVYYLDFDRDRGRFAQGTGHEKRETFGTRLWGKTGNWDYNAETVRQTGTFGADRIDAWMFSLDAGYTRSTAAGKPRFGLKGGIASGDRDARDTTLGTYNALFPRGAYFHESGLIGPANIIDVHPSVLLQATTTVSVSFDYDFFWRQSDHDGVYGPAVNLVRPALGVSGHCLGTQPSVRIEWRPSRHWLVAATAAKFHAGEVIRNSGPGRDVSYFSSWTTYTF